MNVEGGRSIGIGGGVALSAAPSVASLGPKVTELSLPIVNEGPVGRSFLENSMPIKTSVFNPGGEIVFKAQPDVSQAPVEIRMDEKIKPTHPVREFYLPRVEPMIVPLVQSVTKSPAEKMQPQLQPLTEVKVSSKPAQVAVPAASSVLKEQEAIEEKVLTVQDQQNETESEESEDSSESKIKIVEAEKISSERRKKIKRAVKRAKEEDITVAQALTDWNDKSPLVGSGKDWTLDLTAQALEINPNKYTSLEEAEEISIAVVAENIPVEKGEGARQATVDEVRKVIKGEKELLKSKSPAQIVFKRITKKIFEADKNGKILKVLENEAEAVPETTLKDLGLAEIFYPKAA